MSSSELKLKRKRKLSHVVVRLERAVAKCKHLLTKIQILLKENDVHTSEDHSSSTEVVLEISASTELVEELSVSTELVEERSEVDVSPNNSPNSRIVLPDSIVDEFEETFNDVPSISNSGNLAEATPAVNTQGSALKKRKINPVENVGAYRRASAEMLCMNSHVLYAPPSVTIPPVHHRDPRVYLKSVYKEPSFTDTPMRLPVPQMYHSMQKPTELRDTGLQKDCTPNKEDEITPKPAEVTSTPVLTSLENIEGNSVQNEETGKPLEPTIRSKNISPTCAENRPRTSPQNLASQRHALYKSPEYEKDKTMTRNTNINTSNIDHTTRSNPISQTHGENRPRVSLQSLTSPRRTPPKSPGREKDKNMMRNTQIRTPNQEHTVRSNHISPAHAEYRPRASPQSGYQSQSANRIRALPRSPEHEIDKNMIRNTYMRPPQLEHRSNHISPAHAGNRPRNSPQSFTNERRAPPRSPEHEKDKNMARNTHNRTPIRSYLNISPTHAENRPRASSRSGYRSPTLSNISWSPPRSPPRSPEHEKDKNMARNTHNRTPIRSYLNISPTHAENRPRASSRSGYRSPTLSNISWSPPRSPPRSPEHEKDKNMTRNTNVRTQHLEHTVTSSHVSPTRAENRPRTLLQGGSRSPTYLNITSRSPTFSNARWSPPRSPEHEQDKNMARNTHIGQTVRSNNVSPTRAENRPRASSRSGYQSPTFSNDTWDSPKSPEHPKDRITYSRTQAPTYYYSHNHTEHKYKHRRYKTPDRDHSRRPRPRPRCGRRVQTYCNSTSHHRPDRLPRFNYNR